MTSIRDALDVEVQELDGVIDGDASKEVWAMWKRFDHMKEFVLQKDLEKLKVPLTRTSDPNQNDEQFGNMVDFVLKSNDKIGRIHYRKLSDFEKRPLEYHGIFKKKITKK